MCSRTFARASVRHRSATVKAPVTLRAMATLSSHAGFMNRAGTLEVPEVDMKLLDKVNLALFAMDSALKVLLEATLGAAVYAGKMSVYRKLALLTFYESFTLAAAELRSSIDRSENQDLLRELHACSLRLRSCAAGSTSADRGLERSARLSEQKKRLTGLVLEGELEPSDSLIDFVYSLYEENRLQYVQWERCSKKDAEVAGPSSSSKQDANSEEEKLKDNLSSDARIRYALQRRSISFDRVTIATYRVMEKWHDCMFKHRKREALPGHGQVTLQQLEAADKALFQVVSGACRDGIVPKSDGTKPMDEAIEKAMESAEVQFHLLPHLATKEKDKKADDDDKIEKVEKVKKNMWDKNKNSDTGGGKEGKGGGNGGKGDKGGKPRTPMPAGLHGGVPKIDEGVRKHAFIKGRGKY